MNHDYQIDFSQYYGLNKSSSDSSRELKKNAQQIPSLEQIARYNIGQSGANHTEPYPPYMMHACGDPGCTDTDSAKDTGTEDYSDMTSSNQLPYQSYPLTSDSGADTSAAGTEGLEPIQEYNQPFPITAESIQYLNGFLRSQIGRRVTIEFLVGNNCLVTRDGFLLAVGANFILINPTDTDDIMACDFFNIKFIKIYY